MRGGVLLAVLVGLASCRDVVGLEEYEFVYDVCVPGDAPQPCYNGPAGTENVGTCRTGEGTCNADGSGWEACTDVGPAPAENCVPVAVEDPSADVNCNGQVDVCRHEIEWVWYEPNGLPAGIGTDDELGAGEDVFVTGAYPGSATTIAGSPVTSPMGAGLHGGMAIALSSTKESTSVWSAVDQRGGNDYGSYVIADAAAAGGRAWALGLELANTGAPPPAPTGSLELLRLSPAGIELRADAFTGEYSRPVLAVRTRDGAEEVWLGATIMGQVDLDGQGPFEPVGADFYGTSLLARLDPDGGPVAQAVYSGTASDISGSVALARRSDDVIVSGCYEGGFQAPCGDVDATPSGFFLLQYDGNAVCRAAYATSSNVGFEAIQDCNVGAALSEPEGGSTSPVLATAPGGNRVVVQACAGSTCTPFFDETLSTSGDPAHAQIAHVGSDAFGNIYVVFSFRGTFSIPTAMGTVERSRGQTDVAIVKFRRAPSTGAWETVWVETLDRGDGQVQFEEPVVAAVTASGYTYVTGRSAGNVAGQPSPNPNAAHMFVARISP